VEKPQRIVGHHEHEAENLLALIGEQQEGDDHADQYGREVDLHVNFPLPGAPTMPLGQQIARA